jgi:predicted lipid-binding transport protein (Tim44 family)
MFFMVKLLIKLIQILIVTFVMFDCRRIFHTRNFSHPIKDLHQPLKFSFTVLPQATEESHSDWRLAKAVKIF